jgi:RNA polymerase sigma-70 factor (ECF subfamily)
VERHADAVFETALRIVRSREEAEEAAQDAFVRAWRALDGFREEARFSTWLYRIAVRCALDAAARLRQRRDREVAAEPERIERAPAPDRAVTDRRRLERALGRLTAVQRAVVTLFYLRDRPVEEVARILDLPAGTVKTHLHRARGALRRHWGTE